MTPDDLTRQPTEMEKAAMKPLTDIVERMTNERKDKIAALFEGLPPMDKHPVTELYSELLYAVARKFPGETRHQTALRYIREAELQILDDEWEVD